MDWGNINSDLDVIWPGRGLGAGRLEHPLTQFIDETAIPATGMNSAGEIMPADPDGAARRASHR